MGVALVAAGRRRPTFGLLLRGVEMNPREGLGWDETLLKEAGLGYESSESTPGPGATILGWYRLFGRMRS